LHDRHPPDRRRGDVSPPYALKNRSLLSLDELSARDVELLLDLARTLKRDNAEGHEQQMLRGLHIATLTATDSKPGGDCLEAAAAQQGAMVVRIGQQPARQLGSGDRHELPGLLARLYDAIEVRGMTRARLNDFASHCSVPVYRDLSHGAHPARVVADLMTMRECAEKPLEQISVAWLGDPRSERGETLMHGALLMGLDLRLVAPRDSWPTEAAIERLQALARSHGSRLSLHESPAAALDGCDFCYGDRHAMPLRSTRSEPTLLHVNGGGNLDTVRDPVQANQLHAVKAMLVATLA
jgi:ornithine carbamoyltransferase